MRVLFLDDDLSRHGYFATKTIGIDSIAVWDAAQAKQALESGLVFDLVLLDHDLADEHYENLEGKYEGTGLDVCRFIASMPADQRPKQAVVHSMNPGGADRMVAALREAGVPAERCVFGSQNFRRLLEQIS